MKTAKTIVFDLGKVLVDFDYAIAGRKLAARAKMPALELGQFLVHVPLIIRYETGLLTSEEFTRRSAPPAGTSGTWRSSPPSSPTSLAPSSP